MSPQKTVIKLSQEQSKVMDNLPWGPLQVKEKEGRYGPYVVKFSLCSFENANPEAIQVFEEINAGPNETLRSYSGLYDYSKGEDVFFQNPVKGTSSWSQERKDQRKEDVKGLEGGSNTSYSDGAKKGHEENVKMHEEYKLMHEELMKRLDDLNFNIVDNTAAIRGMKKEQEK